MSTEFNSLLFNVPLCSQFQFSVKAAVLHLFCFFVFSKKHLIFLFVSITYIHGIFFGVSLALPNHNNPVGMVYIFLVVGSEIILKSCIKLTYALESSLDLT